MKAIILAAGSGSRIKEFTNDIPKCLIPVNGTPILKKQVMSFRANGITNISVIVGHKAEMIEALKQQLGIKTYLNKNYSTTGMLETFLCAEKELNDDMIVTYGDVYFEKDALKDLIKCKSDICLGIDTSSDPHRDEEFVTNGKGEKIVKAPTKVSIRDGYVQKVSKKLEPQETNGEYIGFAKFSKKSMGKILSLVKSFIESGEIKDYQTFSPLLNLMIGKGEKISAVPISEKLYGEIDYLKDLNELEKKMGKSKIKGIIFDADDVVYERNEETFKPIAVFFNCKGHKISFESFRKAYNKELLKLFKGKVSKDDHLKLTLKNLGIKYDLKFFDEFAKNFRENWSQLKIKEDIKIIFQNLKDKGITISILTDTMASKEKKFEWLKKIGVAKFIDYLICSSETGFTKDQKESYLAAIDKMKLKPKEVLFVGHQAYEMNGAKKAGIKAVSLHEGVGEDIYLEELNSIFDYL